MEGFLDASAVFPEYKVYPLKKASGFPALNLSSYTPVPIKVIPTKVGGVVTIRFEE